MKKRFKNGSLMARPARFVLALVSFYLAFSPPLYALTPEQISNFSTVKTLVYTAYARALAYFPTEVAAGLQKRLGLWAYDPAGRSIYGTFNLTVSRGNSAVGLSSIWASSPYVNSAPLGCEGQVYLGPTWINTGDSWSNGILNIACSPVPWTRGFQGVMLGSSLCTEYNYARYPDHSSGGNCGGYSESCITGGYGYVWSVGKWKGSDGVWRDQSGGMVRSLQIIQGCAPAVPVDSNSQWISAPLSNEILADTSYIIGTLERAKKGMGVDFPTVADYEDFSNALNYIKNGVQVTNGQLPTSNATTPPWDIYVFDSSATIIPGSGGDTPIVSTTVIMVDISPVVNAVNITSDRVDQVGEKITGINDYLVNTDTATAAPHYNAVQTAFNGLLTTISSMPVMGAMNSLLPSDTTSQWEPCFDMGFIWSGAFSGSRPASYTGVYCLHSFAGWNAFVSLIRWGLSLGVMVWGVRYLWGGY